MATPACPICDGPNPETPHSHPFPWWLKCTWWAVYLAMAVPTAISFLSRLVAK